VLILAAAWVHGTGAKENVEQGAAGPPADLNAATVSDSGPIVLDSGPEKRYGIIALPANALPYYRGVYLDGTVPLMILLTQTPVSIPDSWETLRCTTESLRYAAEEIGHYYAYQSDDGWAAFFELPADYPRGCVFMERFIQRFRYFRGVSGPDEVQFPAVIELPRG